jgi:hypothetical protein
MSVSKVAELGQLIDQAASFERSGDYSGAKARIQYAYERLCEEAKHNGSPELEELIRVAEQKSLEYGRLLHEWEEDIARRHAAYLERELPGSSARAPS